MPKKTIFPVADFWHPGGKATKEQIIAAVKECLLLVDEPPSGKITREMTATGRGLVHFAFPQPPAKERRAKRRQPA